MQESDTLVAFATLIYVPMHSFHCNRHRSRPSGQPECAREQRAECDRLTGPVRQLGRAQWCGHRHLQRLLEYQQLVILTYRLTYCSYLHSPCIEAHFSFVLMHTGLQSRRKWPAQ